MLLLRWICAHLIGDFLLQTGRMVRHKQRLKARSWQLYLHCILHGLVFYLLNARWDQWELAAIVAISHFFIDLWKLYQKENAWTFVLDQLLHFSVLVAMWLAITMSFDGFKAGLTITLNNKNMWAVLMGYLLIIWPFSYIIGLATQKWRLDISSHLEAQRTSLAEAGKWIGIFERLLVFTFIITNQFAGIGFLITAKSILRFNETKKETGRKEAEYILIGTLLSFAVAIITGLLINQIIQL